MKPADLLGAVEVGKRAGDPEHAVIAARRQPHGLGGVAQEFRALRVRLRDLLQQRSRRLRIGANLWQSGGRETRKLNVARRATRAATSAEPSAGGGRIRSAAVTAGTSIRRSMRSINGPEMRA